jgi:hypothetical protein
MSGLGRESQCHYPLGDDRPLDYCGAAVQPGSAYCPEHHALCYLPLGSGGERSAIRHINHMAQLAARRREPRLGWVHGDTALRGPAIGGGARGDPAQHAVHRTAPLSAG